MAARVVSSGASGKYSFSKSSFKSTGSFSGATVKNGSSKQPTTSQPKVNGGIAPEISSNKTGRYDSKRGGFVGDDGKFYATSNPNFTPRGYTATTSPALKATAQNYQLDSVKVIGTKDVKGNPITGAYSEQKGGFVTSQDQVYPTRNKDFIPQEILVSRGMARDKNIVTGTQQFDKRTGRLEFKAFDKTARQPANITRQQKQEAKNAELYGTFQEGYATIIAPQSYSKPTVKSVKQDNQIIGYEDTVNKQSVLLRQPIEERTITAIESERARYKTEKARADLRHKENIKISQPDAREEVFKGMVQSLELLPKPLKSAKENLRKVGLGIFIKSALMSGSEQIFNPIGYTKETALGFYSLATKPVQTTKQTISTIKQYPIESFGSFVGQAVFFKAVRGLIPTPKTTIKKIGYKSSSAKLSSSTQSVELSKQAIGFEVKQPFKRSKVVVVQGLSTTKILPTAVETKFYTSTKASLIATIEGKKKPLFKIKGTAKGISETEPTLIKGFSLLKTQTSTAKETTTGRYLTVTKSLITKEEPLLQTKDFSLTGISKKNIDITKIPTKTKYVGTTKEISRNIIPLDNDNILTYSKFVSVGLGTENKKFINAINYNIDARQNRLMQQSFKNIIKAEKQKPLVSNTIMSPEGLVMIKQQTFNLKPTSFKPFSQIARQQVKLQFKSQPTKSIIFGKILSVKKQDSILKQELKTNNILKIKQETKYKTEQETKKEFSLFTPIINIGKTFDIGKSFSIKTATKSIQEQTPIQKQASIEKVIPISRPYNYPVTRTSTAFTPFIIPIQPKKEILFFPTSFIGGAGNKPKKKKKISYFGFKTKYTPSVEAIQLNIFGKQPQGKGQKELGLRPILKI